MPEDFRHTDRGQNLMKQGVVLSLWAHLVHIARSLLQGRDGVRGGESRASCRETLSYVMSEQIPPAANTPGPLLVVFKLSSA